MYCTDDNQTLAIKSTSLKVMNVQPSKKIPYKQNELQQQLVKNATELERLIKIKNLGLASQDNIKNIEKVKSDQSSLVKSLKRLKDNVEYSKKSRALKKVKLESLQFVLPEENLVKAKPGPWPIEK
ncbi:hypothetical protein RDWZM_003630 [Blomia tropicalis]|uniref:Uncharacterized protein n=1 Tax=Blomia tropicalis TaxID=40697 RepID=A0A9Q0RSV4_BLOTA|nr:hypothetical protein RDWZM_003630 [Blomia tropicalis]